MDAPQPGQTVSPSSEPEKSEATSSADPSEEISVELNHSEPAPKNTAVPAAVDNETTAGTSNKEQQKAATTPKNKPEPVVNTVKDKPATTGWRFSADDQETTENTKPAPALVSEPIAWSASEFVHHQKSFGWYTTLLLGAALLAAVVFLLTKDKISTGVVIFAAIGFAAYANHKPHVKQYKLDNSGLAVGEKFYKYGEFKSFAVAGEGQLASVILNPFKRFVPPLLIYVAPEDEEKIVDMLAYRLPIEEHKPDVVDRFLGKIRF